MLATTNYSLGTGLRHDAGLGQSGDGQHPVVVLILTGAPGSPIVVFLFGIRNEERKNGYRDVIKVRHTE